MTVTFRKELKISDVIEWYENDDEMAHALSRVMVEWDLKDPYTGEDIPLPEFDTGEWYRAITFEQFTELIDAWVERRDAVLPNPKGEQS